MIARVVTKRDDARLAMVTALGAALSLLLVLVDDVWGVRLFRPTPPSSYLFVALIIALGAVAPWLAWTRRGRAVQVRFADGVVHAGKVRIAAGEVSALSIKSGSRGQSIAIRHGKSAKKGLTFIEVERAEDATKIAETLGVSEVPFGALEAPRARRFLALPQITLGLVSAACAPLYFIAATHGFGLGSLGDTKALFGLSGVVVTQLALLLLVVRSVRGHAVALRNGVWDAHAAMHREAASEAKEAELTTEAPARTFNLARGDEGVGAWLARLDALPTDTHAYRGDAMKKDLLWETLGDTGASVDARMGAARVLRRRYGEEERVLIRVVEDPDVRVRVEAALEEHEEAERHLEHLGPLFRAR